MNHCSNMSEAIEALGYKRTSGAMKSLLKEIILEKGLDISHFNPYKRAHVAQTYHPMNEILVENSSYTNIARLKIRLVNEGILKYECAICGNRGEWLGKPLSLQLDHIDGNHSNHSLQNLRFLCPNCHTQTDTFSGKNAKYGNRKI